MEALLFLLRGILSSLHIKTPFIFLWWFYGYLQLSHNLFTHSMSEDWWWPSFGTNSPSVYPSSLTEVDSLRDQTTGQEPLEISEFQEIINQQFSMMAQDSFNMPRVPIPPRFGHLNSMPSMSSQASSVSDHRADIDDGTIASVHIAPPFGNQSTAFKFVPTTVSFAGGAMSSRTKPSDANKYLQFFSAEADTDDAELEKDRVLIPKELRGTPGSKDYINNMVKATTSIEHKFGVAYHFVSSQNGEVEEGNQTKQQFIQDTYITNLTKLDDLDSHMQKYDMKDQFFIGKLKAGLDPTSVKHVADLWDHEQLDLFQHWDKISWETACYWQYSINKRCEGEDKTSNKWALEAIKNSCTTDLKDLINHKYGRISSSFKGAVTYAWILCFNLFATSQDTTASLKAYLQLWESKGLQCIRGESVVVAQCEVVAVARCLDATGDLPDETTVDVLTGLTKCSCPHFREVFKSYLQDAPKESLELTNVRPWGHTRVLDEVIMFMDKALSYYHNLCTSNKWHIPRDDLVHVGTVGGITME